MTTDMPAPTAPPTENGNDGFIWSHAAYRADILPKEQALDVLLGFAAALVRQQQAARADFAQPAERISA